MSETKVTKGYKVSPETREKLESLKMLSGISTDEQFIEHMAVVFEMQQIKDGVTGYKRQLDELDIHTRRVNEIFLSMISMEGAERLELIRVHDEKMMERSQVIFSLDQQVNELKKMVKRHEDDLAKALKEQSDISTQLGQAQEISRKGNLLVEEYSKQILSLTGMLDENKAAVDESKNLKTQLSELTKLTESRESRIEQLEKELMSLEAARVDQLMLQGKRHLEVLERNGDKKDLEKERELLAVRTEYQAKFEKSNEEATEKIRGLYEQIDKMREASTKVVKPKSQ